MAYRSKKNHHFSSSDELQTRVARLLHLVLKTTLNSVGELTLTSLSPPAVANSMQLSCLPWSDLPHYRHFQLVLTSIVVNNDDSEG
jgi:hypothetical protein